MSTLMTDARAAAIAPNRSNRLCPQLVRKERASDCCFSPRSELRLPDPAIYSQRQIIKRDGLTAHPSWQSPDIITNLWQPARLMPEAQITVNNLSAVASAAGVRVDVFVFRFGIGFPRELIGGSQLSIAPAGQATFLAPFPQRILNGEQRIGVEVRITHSTDLNVENNVGLHAYQAFYTSDVGRDFLVSFPVRNPSASAQSIYIDNWLTGGGGFSINLPFPVPGPYGPFEERLLVADVSVAPSVSAGPTIRREWHLRAFGADGQLIDGLSFLVNVDA
jgi:hypothetical protein